MEEKERNSVQAPFDQLLKVIETTYEERTGRTGSFWYMAPETSMTKSLVMLVMELRNELNELKEELNVK